MAEVDVAELVVHLDKNLDLSTMEQGVKLVGKVMSTKTVNKWGVRNILRSAWKEMGEIEIKWVKDNIFIIIVQDESTAAKILDRVPWGVMKQNFLVKSWSQELALEEVDMDNMPFWIQIRGIPPSLSSDKNLRHIGSMIGNVEEVEDPARAKGFLRIKVNVNTLKPLITGCWLPREGDNETWVEFRYERLQDFCYKCGRIGHANTECHFDAVKAGFGEWMKAQPVWDVIDTPKILPLMMGERRMAGAVRKGAGKAPRQTEVEVVGNVNLVNNMGEPAKPKKKWQRKKRGFEGVNLHPTQWIIDGCGLTGQHHLVIGFEQMEAQLQGGKISTVLIEDLENDLSSQDEGRPSELLIKTSTSRQVNEETDRRMTSSTTHLWGHSEYGMKEKQLEEAISHYKKQKLEMISDITTVNVGSTSQGGDGWPSTAARSP